MHQTERTLEGRAGEGGVEVEAETDFEAKTESPLRRGTSRGLFLGADMREERRRCTP